MFGLGLIEILILIFVLGAFAGVRRSGAARGGVAVVLLGGLALLALLMLGTSLLWVTYRAQPIVQQASRAIEPAVNTAGYAAHQAVQFVDGAQSVTTHTSWNFSLVPIWVILLGMFAAVMILRRIFSPAPACGHRRIWPALLAIPLLAFFFLGTVRYQVHRSTDSRSADVAREAEIAMAKTKTRIDAQRAQIEAKAKRIDQMDIFELMDQFDAPRIPLSVLPQAAPIPPFALVSPPQVPTSGSLNRAGKSANVQNRPNVASANRNKAKKPKPQNAPAAPAAPPAAQMVAISQSPDKPAIVAKTEVANTTAVAEAPAAPEQSAKKVAPADELFNSDAVRAATAKSALGRPAWVDQTPKRTGNTRYDIIATDEYESADECYLAGDIYLLLKTWQRMQQVGGRPYPDGPLPSPTFRNGGIYGDGQLMSYGRGNGYWEDGRLQSLRNMGITADYLRREIVSKDPANNEPREYLETAERSFGPMKKLYLQIEYSPSFDDELKRHWRALKRGERFEMVGFGAVSILGLVGLVFALLKVDTATKGYYTKRLFIGVPLAILGFFGLYAMLVKMGADLPH
jgi:hypothetical protein